MPNNLQQFAMNMIRQNPDVRKSKNAQTMLNVIENNDQAAGEQIAMNFCRTYGLSKEEAVAQAKAFFGLK